VIILVEVKGVIQVPMNWTGKFVTSAQYREWYRTLPKMVKGAIKNKRRRITTIRKINDCDWVMPEKEIVNMMVDLGPGYRVYCHLSKVIFLMWGGNKGSQSRDILTAKRLLADAKKRLGGRK